MNTKKLIAAMRVRPGRRVSLADYKTGWTGHITDKHEADALLQEGIDRLAAQQERLYAEDSYALLVIFQAMDAAGKDSTIKHVMRGVNPQGCQVFSFKAPSSEERDHDYLWRSVKALPERGRIGIHNRSYYEEVLVARVDPAVLASQQLPEECKTGDIWSRRFRHIRVRRHLAEDGVIVVKFYLNVSRKEQKSAFWAHRTAGEELEVLIERRQAAVVGEGYGGRTRTSFRGRAPRLRPGT